MPRLSDRSVGTLKGGNKRAERTTSSAVFGWWSNRPAPSRSRFDTVRLPKTAKVTLGSYPRLPLAGAREKARDVLTQVAVGRDPAEERRVEKAVMGGQGETETAPDVFDATLEAFFKRYVDQRCRPSTQAFYRTALRVHVLPYWQGRRLQEIVKRDVLDVVDRVNEKSPVMANRVLAVLKVFLRWAVDQDILAASPATDVRRPALEKSRERVLADDELRLVWFAAEKQGYPFGSTAQLLILLGQRRGEVAGARWAEIDIAKRLWTIPGARTKNGDTHVVPLSDAAVAVIQSLPRLHASPWLFSTTGTSAVSGFSRSKRYLDKHVAN